MSDIYQYCITVIPILHPLHNERFPRTDWSLKAVEMFEPIVRLSQWTNFANKPICQTNFACCQIIGFCQISSVSKQTLKFLNMKYNETFKFQGTGKRVLKYKNSTKCFNGFHTIITGWVHIFSLLLRCLDLADVLKNKGIKMRLKSRTVTF